MVWFISPINCGKTLLILFTSGIILDCSITVPVISPVLVFIPNWIVNKYVFVLAHLKYCISLVAPFNAIGNNPLANGSNVPTCPILLIPNCLLHILSTVNEVIPSGLSINNTPVIISSIQCFVTVNIVYNENQVDTIFICYNYF